MPVQVEQLRSIKRDLVKQIESVADYSRVNQKPVSQRKPQPFLRRKKRKVHERGRSQSSKRENDPTCIKGRGHEREWRRDEERNPRQFYESEREKLIRTDYKRKKSSCHQAVQAAEYVCIKMNLMQ